MGVSENSVPLNPMVLLIIIPIKWLFHWEYTLFSDIPISWLRCFPQIRCWPRSGASSAKTVRSVEAWAAEGPEGPCGARLRAAADVVVAAFSISPVTCLALSGVGKCPMTWEYKGHHLIVAIIDHIPIMVEWCETWGHLMTHVSGFVGF